MRRLRLACLLVLALAYPAAAPRAAAPPTLPGLAAPVTIVTDEWGIPHVRAANLGDLYEAWGWVIARDRLWQLVLSRAQGRGETHRWFGNAALSADGAVQLFRLRERAAAIWARDGADPGLHEAVTRYCAGINAYMAECRRGERAWPAELTRLHAGPDDWQPADVVLLLLGLGVTLDLDAPEVSESRAMREQGPDWVAHRRRFEGEWIYDSIPDSAARRLWGAGPHAARISPATGSLPASTLALAATAQATFPPHDADGADRASNEMAVGGARSSSGRPLLANDPHLHLTSPGPFHVIHVSVPGIVDAIGADVPGLPSIVSGNNRRCAWGVTSLGADVVDAYADTLDASGTHVRWQGGWTPLVVRPFALSYSLFGFAIPVPAFAQARRYTPHGPVVVFDKKERLAISLRWSAMEDARITLRRLVGLERSQSAAEVTARYRTLTTPAINCVAADVDGAVLYQATGLVPKRPFAFTRGVLPDDGRHEWAGFVPADSMPAWRVSPDGFVVNANNRPVGPAYPYAFERYDWAHDRAARMAQRLAGDRSLTLADLASVQNDEHSRWAERAVPALVHAVEGASLTARERAALDTLRAWDDLARRGRIAPTLARAWWDVLQHRSRTEGLPGLTLAALQGRAADALRAPGGQAPETVAVAARRALDIALDSLATQLGPDPARWAWGRIHRARFEHALAQLDGRARWEAAPIAVDGDGSTVAVAGSRPPYDNEVTHGPAFRHVVDLARPDSSLGVVPPMNSAHAAPDLREAWADHRYVPFLLDWPRIQAHARETLVLSAPGASAAPR